MKRPKITSGPFKLKGVTVEAPAFQLRATTTTDTQTIATVHYRPYGSTNPSQQPLAEARNLARAIAALPDLLAALEKMLEAYAPYHQETVNHRGGEDSLHSAVRAARQALIKAGYTFTE